MRVLCLVVLVSGCAGTGVVELGSPATVASPLWGDVVDGQVPVLVDAEPRDRVDAVTLSIGGEVRDEDLLPPYELSFDTSTLDDGEHELLATIHYRTLGPVVASSRVVVDNHGPAIAVLSADCGAGSIAVEADVYDDVPVVGVEFRIDGRPIAHFENGPYRLELDHGAGSTLTVAAENERGLISASSVAIGPCP